MSLTSHLALEQKAALASGADFFSTKAVDAIPSIRTSDGPHGLRKQETGGDHLGIARSVPSTCFPPACGLSQSWNVDLVARVGAALGRECRAEDIQVLLGPGVNIKRSPLGGRSFEYFSEDPVLTAALGTAWVTGIQSEGVGASVKHFAGNEQETDRQRVSTDVDPRPLREVYLRAFERIVREARPWTVMSSYNRLNGVRAGENEFLLRTVLRDEWNFDGVVVCDWGDVTDRVAAARAGVDLEMPSSGGVGDRALLSAVENGTLPETVVDELAERVAELARRGAATLPLPSYDKGAHHELARAAAAQSIVLLKNEGDVLPLSHASRVAVIGSLAVEPRYQGGGSSRTEPTFVDIPLEELRRQGGDHVSYAAGYDESGANTVALREEAVALATANDTVVVFLGLGEMAESEGWDRTHIDLPSEQLDLARAVFAANPRTVAVIARGGVVAVEPLAELPGLVDCALLGQGGGRALAEVLYGEVNPSGHLTETIPVRLSDSPAFLDFPGERGHVRYSEGIYVGHRWYDARDLAVSYPFGHGLSYTTFGYSNLTLESAEFGIVASLDVTNTGGRTGRAVPQLYVSVDASSVVRPPLELKGFASLELNAGETKRASALLRRDDLAYWDVQLDRWIVEPGTYRVHAGASSRDLPLEATIDLAGDVVRPVFTMESTFAELMGDPIGGAIVQQALGQMMTAGGAGGGADAEGGSPAVGEEIVKVMGTFPWGRMVSFSGGAATADQLQQLLDAVNAGHRNERP